jgi:hypothetical protein
MPLAKRHLAYCWSSPRVQMNVTQCAIEHNPTWLWTLTSVLLNTIQRDFERQLDIRGHLWHRYSIIITLYFLLVLLSLLSEHENPTLTQIPRTVIFNYVFCCYPRNNNRKINRRGIKMCQHERIHIHFFFFFFFVKVNIKL